MFVRWAVPVSSITAFCGGPGESSGWLLPILPCSCLCGPLENIPLCIQQRFWLCKRINLMQTFQDIGLKLNPSITILKQKITQTESTTEMKKNNPNQIKPNSFFLNPFKKRQKKFIFVFYLYSQGRVPACWQGCRLFSFALSSVVRFSWLHETSYWCRRIPSYFVIFLQKVACAFSRAIQWIMFSISGIWFRVFFMFMVSA